MKDLAPIGVSTYSRLEHLKQTIDALKSNYLAEESELYIFSDAPRPGDVKGVEAVRLYANSITGFKSVNVFEREKNNRAENNRGGMKFLLDNYDKMIFLEEDVITSPYFLQYLNESLQIYENDQSIISISGYCPPIRIPASYNKDAFLLKRFNAWGFGTWKHKFDPFSYSVDTDTYNQNIKRIKPELERYGNDIPRMLKKEVEGDLDALDVKVMYHQVMQELYTVYPVKSLTRNIGFDGSGLHCAETKRFEIDLAQNKLKPVRVTEENEKIVTEHRRFRNQTGRFFFYKLRSKIRNTFSNV